MKKNTVKSSDLTLSWVIRDHPELSQWHEHAVKWLANEHVNLQDRLQAFIYFFRDYLYRENLPSSPAKFLERGSVLPDFYSTACPQSAAGIKYTSIINQFINYVLLTDYSDFDDNDQPIVSPAFHNPIRIVSRSILPKYSESIYNPLPYGYVDELRKIIVEGSNFIDWKWARSALGAKEGIPGPKNTDWFEVNNELINKRDPDCVWRERIVNKKLRYEIWSPVRWVGLLTKLILPLRTYQVRMLDSGEADTWRYSRKSWKINFNLISEGNESRPLEQGVFRRAFSPLGDSKVSTVFYVNTNKTADIQKSGIEKGYTFPWLDDTPLHQDIFYWLEKLRDWQEKYNPVKRRTNWSELDHRHMSKKSEKQLLEYPNACFLFRNPDAKPDEKHLPMHETAMHTCWFKLLEKFENKLEAREETHSNGDKITLLPNKSTRKPGSNTTLFPLHSLRVSIITALALDGQLPLTILQKLVGHSRLIMTLYYVKPGQPYIHQKLSDAAEYLESKKEESIVNFIKNTEHHNLVETAICNDPETLQVSVQKNTGDRNPAGWMMMHHGICLAGGNTVENQENKSLGGCFNGGDKIYKGDSSRPPRYEAVAGGARNCIRCRWFVTEPHYLPSLVAHFNNLSYHLDESRNDHLRYEQQLTELKKEKLDAEENGLPFEKLKKYRQVERLWEKTIKRFSDISENIVACWRLVERCKKALQEDNYKNIKFISIAPKEEISISFEETDSELLQLSGVCGDIEIYPDLEPGKAILRRSQILDQLLYRENIPPLFMNLSEEDQLTTGNAFIQRLAIQADTLNPELAKNELITLIESKQKIRDFFDVDLEMALSTEEICGKFSYNISSNLLDDIKND
ncbi:integrase [Halomonas sp. ATBC28]|uniref:gamma-mobile-trio integrase GmtZ n=1 Tax=Halomonas sp. ATBC28 TaxID=2545264 RepID=UPI00110E58CB|nr:VPA1269 family protein [Halomonas sp. ATBC28]TMU24525.1 integrase [Halomonas sp. ATBC28]